jgi:hypothetical protein
MGEFADSKLTGINMVFEGRSRTITLCPPGAFLAAFTEPDLIEGSDYSRGRLGRLVKTGVATKAEPQTLTRFVLGIAASQEDVTWFNASAGTGSAAACADAIAIENNQHRFSVNAWESDMCMADESVLPR